MTTPEECLRRACLGASRLDRRESGWRMRITAPFNASSPFRSVLGQLYGAHAAGVRKLCLAVDDSWKLGFAPELGQKDWMDELQTAWLEVLTDPVPRYRERWVGPADGVFLISKLYHLNSGDPDGPWRVAPARSLAPGSVVEHPDAKRAALVVARRWDASSRVHVVACSTLTGRTCPPFTAPASAHVLSRRLLPQDRP